MSAFTATKLQIATYLLAVCPFSIAFLVFLNSSVSFVVTDLIGREHGVGDVVGNLGFADELVALIACPFWGLLSDRIGVRSVCVIGFTIICLALVLFVQAQNVYPQLLLGRLFFSVGGAAASTMVTAVLPTMSYIDESEHSGSRSRATVGHVAAPSIASELTITPARFQSSGNRGQPNTGSGMNPTSSTSQIAGFVGMCTGLGALMALLVFLPLPASMQRNGTTPGRALQYSYYIVAAIALFIALSCFLGFRGLKSERNKGWKFLLRGSNAAGERTSIRQTALHTATMLYRAFVAGTQRSDIALGYLGGFVARASSVGISLFIPLLVNAMFLQSGLCTPQDSNDRPIGLPDIKRRCPRAYVVAAELTGVSQTVALVMAPMFGYWSARTSRKTLPLSFSAVSGIIGYPLFATQFNPDDNERQARVVAFVAVCFIGISQIGAIVCSLASLGSGVLLHSTQSSSSRVSSSQQRVEDTETDQEPLLGQTKQESPLSELKGSIAGVYSFYGGAAILILTKLGGNLFDNVNKGAPFYIMTAFNVVLLVATIAIPLARRISVAKD